VDCFSYVQVGRAFGGDFHSSQVRLRTATLRLARWGKAVGLCIVNDKPDPNSIVYLASTDERGDLLDLLDDIFNVYTSLKKDSDRYLKKAKPEDIVTFDPNSEPDVHSLNKKLKAFTMRYETKSSLVGRASWALYRKDKVEELLTRLTGYINNLTELFPAKEEQLQLVKAEVATISDAGSLSELRGIIDNEDLLLKEAVTAKLETEFYNVFRNGRFTGGESHIGSNYAAGEKRNNKGNLFDGFEISAGSHHLGDNYGYAKDSSDKSKPKPTDHMDYMDDPKFGL
jgi:hypothetical protein